MFEFESLLHAQNAHTQINSDDNLFKVLILCFKLIYKIRIFR